MPAAAAHLVTAPAGAVPAWLGGHEPAPLPPAPALARLFLENPWPAWAALAVAAVTAYVLWNQARRRAGALAAAGLGLLGAALWSLAAVVVTPREELAARTRELVAVVAAGDAARLASFLTEDMTASAGPLGGTLTRERVLGEVAGAPSRGWRLETYRVLEVRAAVDAPHAGRTHARVRVTPEATGTPIISWWRLHWRAGPEGAWRLETAELLG
ncbi:MAG TPA: hypothetical protein VD963_06610 [Phycisphaerales bacterium]|nr:hypothetical protein [Phycisphaerales bacterium]